MHCGWCGEKLTTYHKDWVYDCKVCHPCYLRFEKYLRESSNYQTEASAGNPVPNY